VAAHRDDTEENQKKADAGRPGKFVTAGGPPGHETTHNTGEYRPPDARYHVTHADASHIEGDDSSAFTCGDHRDRENKAGDDAADTA